MRLRMAGRQRDRLAAGLLRLVEPVELLQQRGERVPGRGIVGIERDPKVTDEARVLGVQGGEIGLHGDELGRQRQRLAERVLRASRIACGVQRQPQQVQELRSSGQVFERLSRGRYRRFRIAASEQRRDQGGLGLQIAGAEPHHVRVRLNRTGEISLCDAGVAEIEPNLLGLGVEECRAAKRLHRLGPASSAPKSDAEARREAGIFGPLSARHLEARHRLLALPGLQRQHAREIERLWLTGIVGEHALVEPLGLVQTAGSVIIECALEISRHPLCSPLVDACAGLAGPRPDRAAIAPLPFLPDRLGRGQIKPPSRVPQCTPALLHPPPTWIKVPPP